VTRQRMTAVVVTVLATIGIVLGGAASPAGAATAGPASSYCRSGWVCLYTGAAGSAPSGAHTDYYYYGAHDLSNVLNWHWLVNTQTGGAKVYPCYGYGGVDCNRITFYYPDGSTAHYLKAGYMAQVYFTPVNSLRLTA